MRHFLMDWLYQLQHSFVKWFVFLSFGIALLFTFGLFSNQRHYFDTANFLMKTYIAVYLVVRFNSYQKDVQFTPLDKLMCYSAGLYLMGATVADYFIAYIPHLKLPF